MSREERERLADIRNAIAAIGGHMATANESGFSPVIHDALLYQLVVIGEAAKHVSESARQEAPEVEWAGAARLRDMIAHQYFDIEMGQIVAIVERDLPGLDDAVRHLLDTSG